MKKWLIAGSLVALCVVLGGWFSPGNGVSGGGGGGASALDVSIPDTIFVAEGRECNLWFDQLTAAVPGAPYFTVVADCDSGSIKPRSWRWTPWATGAPDAVPLTLETIDPAGKVKRTSTAVAQSVEKDYGTDAFQALFIGDSIFVGPSETAKVVAEVYDLVDADDGSDLTMLGTQGSGTDLHEAYTGRGIRHFVGSASPFWDTDELNFQSYMTDNSFTGNIDFAVIQLGANDCSWIVGDDAMTTAELDSVVIYTKALIDSLHSATVGYPACEVIIGLIGFPPLDQSAFGSSYAGAAWWPDYVENMRKYQNRMIAEFDGGAYGDKVDVCLAGAWVDRQHGYTYTQAAVSARSDTTETLYSASSFLHPNVDGYEQLADAYYSHLRWLMYQYDPGCTNELGDSYDFSRSSGTYWSNPAAYWTSTGDQDDPWGYDHGTLVEYTTTTAYFYQYNTTGIAVNANDMVVSIFIKNDDMGTDEYTMLRIVDTTSDPDLLANARLTWTTPTPTYVAPSSTLACNGGVESIGDGWYRLWTHIDLAATETVGHTFSFRWSPNEGGPESGDSMWIGGMQVEYDVTESCGTYVEKPES